MVLGPEVLDADGAAMDQDQDGATREVSDDVFFARFSIQQASIQGRHIFYNNSSFDGDDADAGPSDDAAIATYKTPLLPGGTGTFANYISHTRGINGIMVDIAGLADPAAVGDDDFGEFTFTYGNDDTPGDWPLAPDPEDIEVRDLGGGVSRVTIVWADNAIADRNWLEVTVRGGVTTGLAADDVFYFGGYTGEMSGDFVVDFDDLLSVLWPEMGAGVGVNSPADVNRDGTIDFDDILEPNGWWANIFGWPPLWAISPPVPPPAPSVSLGYVFNEDLDWAADVAWFDELYGTSNESEEEGVLEEDAVDGVFEMYAEE